MSGREFTPIIDVPKPALGGIRSVYRFANGFGASVIRNPYSYGGDKGLFELAVLQFNGENFKLCYDTPITNDVIGYLSESEVLACLGQIDDLPATTPDKCNSHKEAP